MSYANMHGALKQYRRIGVDTEIPEATPHRRVQLLLEGILDRVAVATGCIERGDIPGKGAQIGRAVSIIDNLRAALDHEVGGEMVGNLDSLYVYMARRLTEANLHNRVADLQEVAALVREIKLGWDAIPGHMGGQRYVAAASA